MATTASKPATSTRTKSTSDSAALGADTAGRQNGNHNAKAAAQPSRAEDLSIGLERKDMDATIVLLNQILANYLVMATKTKNYHWNVVSIAFNDLHKFFEKTYQILSEEADEVAERIRTLGGRPLGNMAAFIEHASLHEEIREGLSPHDMVRSLLADEEEVIRQLRQAVDETEDKYDDKGTSDFLTGLMENREKHAWMLRSLAQ